jgi:membrane-associated phospholipid phosphatase
LNNRFFDGFFRVVTAFGAFPLIAAIAVITLFIRFRIALTILASSLFAVVFTQLGKRVIWPDSPRPKVLFEGLDSFHYVDGVHLHSAHSFPSGHTSGAFALFIVLALFARKPWLKLLFLLAGMLVAYSRMYLSQHFLVDVTAGSFIGVTSALLAYWWMNAPAYKGKRGLDKRLTLSQPWIG